MLLDMYKGVANSPETTITNNINETDTIIYVLDETKVPAELPNLMVLGTGASAETVKILSIDGNAITVQRGFQGVPKAWNTGTIIARNFTEYDYNTLVENVKKMDTRVGPLTSLLTRIKTSIVNALNGLQGDLDEHKADDVSGADGVHGLKIESGVFSPQLYLGGSTLEAEYSSQIGVYTKVGKRVFFTAMIKTTKWVHSSTIQAILMGGLPFSIQSSPSQQISCNGYIDKFVKAGYTQITPLIRTNLFGDAILFYAMGTNQNPDYFVAQDLPSGTNVEIFVSGSYLTN